MSDKFPSDKVIQKTWPGSYTYDSSDYNTDPKTRYRVTNGPGGRDCMDIAEGPTERIAKLRAASEAEKERRDRMRDKLAGRIKAK
jgi:hypothetical protein